MRATLFLNRYRYFILASLALLAAFALFELHGGSSFFGPDGRFGWWSGDIQSRDNSQRVADAYSFTHVLHGILLYAGLWLCARRLPARWRFLLALVLECGWEVVENLPFVIDRYRAGTVTLGYYGDSVLNSLSDICMAALGFLAAYRLRVRLTIALFIIVELALLLWIRDNLTLNVVMLAHPIDAITAWQAAR